MIRGASRCDEPKTPVVASVPAARAATVAAPTRADLINLRLLGFGGRRRYAAASAAVVKLAATDLQLEQRALGLDHLIGVRERDLLQRLGVRQGQIGAGHPGDRGVEIVERLLLD